MTIGVNNIITYKDLVDYAVTKIKSMCHNIDAFASNVPAMYKNGTTLDKASLYKAANSFGAAHTSYLRATTSDGSLVVVSSATVENDLTAFFQSRGLHTKADTVMSFKNVINFFNNLTAFMSVKVWQIYSPFETTRTVVFYNPNSVTYPTVNLLSESAEHLSRMLTYYKPVEPFDINNPQYTVEEVQEVSVKPDEELTLTADELITSVNDFMGTINNITNAHQALVTLSFVCSSCSSSSCSSSSSSSSSSSCSSSSSSFIAYMDI